MSLQLWVCQVKIATLCEPHTGALWAAALGTLGAASLSLSWPLNFCGCVLPIYPPLVHLRGKLSEPGAGWEFGHRPKLTHHSYRQLTVKTASQIRLWREWRDKCLKMRASLLEKAECWFFQFHWLVVVWFLAKNRYKLHVLEWIYTGNCFFSSLPLRKTSQTKFISWK